MNRREPSRVLVTGGAGFIGSHLSELLLNERQEVWVLDDLSTGSLSNIAHLRGRPLFHFNQGSVMASRDLFDLVKRVDSIYHLAASVGVRLVVESLVDSIANNVRGTELVLKAAADAGKKVLITSTSEVYGRGEKEIFSENDDLAMGPTTRGRWSYACSKALDEYMAFAYRQEFELPVTVVRLFNTVGERQSSHYGMVLPTLVRQALAGKPLTIHGDGKQSRCFCYVGDVVRALKQLMEHPETDGEVYNAGSQESVTINELADKVLEITGSKSEIQLVPYEEAYLAGFDDISRRVPDISKIKTLINWQPTLGLAEIIQRVRDDAAVQVGGRAIL